MRVHALSSSLICTRAGEKYGLFPGRSCRDASLHTTEALVTNMGGYTLMRLSSRALTLRRVCDGIMKMNEWETGNKE